MVILNLIGQSLNSLCSKANGLDSYYALYRLISPVLHIQGVHSDLGAKIKQLPKAGQMTRLTPPNE